jgi:hypothetical protein
MKMTATQKLVPHAHPSQAALDSIVALRLYSIGKADKASVLAALRRLDHIYGQPVKGALALFERSLHIGDKAVQNEIRFEALSQITDWVFRHRIQASLWGEVSNICRALRDGFARLTPRLDMPGGFAGYAS